MKTNNNKAYRLIRKLSCEKCCEPKYTNVIANEFTSQVLLNLKIAKLKLNSGEKIIRDTSHETSFFDIYFTIEKLNTDIKIMRKGKTARVDDIQTEQIRNIEPRAREWLLNMYNVCTDQM